VNPQTFDPKKRITVEDALAHPYLEAYVHSFVSLKWSTDPLRLAWPRRWACGTTTRPRILRVRL
jgi:hypothetical protein